MLSQLNLRFHKKLIEALKVRAGRENTSVNALAERFLDNGLKTVAPGDGYFQLVADPDATVRQLYRHIILGQTFGTAPVSRDELRFILTYAREAFICGQNRLATLPALGTLLNITRDLLAWQVENDRPVDGHYLYTAIAEGLARSISALDENVSTVIGIEGQWGSGKTSLLNLLTDKLKAQVPATTQIVVFSPWVNSPDESPVNALMMTIAARLAKLDTSAMAQAGKVAPLAEDILNYAQQTSRRLAPVTRFAGNFIPGLGLVADGMDALANTGLSGREKTAAELRADIEDKIAGLGVSFIVVIDDLDRLEPAQAVEVLRMVRSVADFSRFRYVMCYDRDVLAHAVETGLGVQNGKRYLQKIIPLSFSLPRPENFALRREFHRGAMTIWQEVSGPVTDNESSELLSHYVDVYGEGLSTPREVNQVLNSIRFRYPGLRDYVFYPDLCLLQLISVVNPLFAGWVEHYLTVWSVVENRDGIAHEDEQKALIAELAEALKKFGASRAASVWELRAWLPGISGFEYDHLRLFETIPLQDTERYRQKRRLCSGEYWRYYFSYSSPQNVMSDEDISSIMKLAACNYAGLKKRLLDSVTSNGVSSRTWFEHILTRLSPSVTVGAETSAKRNLVKFFFSCSD